MMNYASPGRVADAGTYALIGSAAVLGGMSRMTISGTVIILEACGNASYLLPLMLTFSAARYVGNMFNASLYDIQLKLRDYPFLPGEPCAIGLMGVAEVGRVMAAHVVAVNEVESVRNLVAALSKTKHNGFPVVRAGRLQGLVLRKTLCQLLKLRAFSSYVAARGGAEGLELQADATIFYGTLEKGYPDYPAIEDVALSDADMVRYASVLPSMADSVRCVGQVRGRTYVHGRVSPHCGRDMLGAEGIPVRVPCIVLCLCLPLPYAAGCSAPWDCVIWSSWTLTT